MFSCCLFIPYARRPREGGSRRFVHRFDNFIPICLQKRFTDGQLEGVLSGVLRVLLVLGLLFVLPVLAVSRPPVPQYSQYSEYEWTILGASVLH